MKTLLETINSWRQWYWIPATVALLGLLAIVLILWADRISERLRSEADIVDAIMDAQIHAAKAHLWIEHIILGGTEGDLNSFTSELDQSVALIEAILEGGAAEHEWIDEPLADPELRARAAEIRSLLVNLKRVGLQRLQNQEQAGLEAVLHPLFDELFREIFLRARALEEIMEIDEAKNERESKRLILGLLGAWLAVVTVATTGLWNNERKRKSAERKLRLANEQLRYQAEELTEHREHLADLVERRTAELRTANELLRAEMAERLQACESLQEREQQIRRLSGRLLRAQEVERRRISMELHDELGQALNVVKLHLRAFEKDLREDQESVKSDCSALRDYVGQVIEDVRRISLDLSPTVLEDLGLSSALNWLIGNLKKLPDLKVTADIADIDHLFPREQWITLYRVLQEALTNIVKHARADIVSVTVRPEDETVLVFVEDNGIGFDPPQEAAKDAPEKGFGLKTMDERVRMLGGIFKIRSRKGEGTRIAFTIPCRKGEELHGPVQNCSG